MNNSESKTCKKCLLEKTLGHFIRKKEVSNTYYTPICRECVNKNNREKHKNDEEYRNRHKEYVRKNNEKSRNNPELWGKRILRKIRQRIKILGVPLSLTCKDIADVMPKDKICPALKMQMTNIGRSSNNFSIDRIISHLGYVKGNIAIISTRANAIKQNATYKQIKLVALWTQKMQLEVKKKLGLI